MTNLVPLSISIKLPIPGIQYSNYDITVQGKTEEELKANYEIADRNIMQFLKSQKLISKKETLKKFLENKNLVDEYIDFIKNN